MKKSFKILTFTLMITGFVIARGNNTDSGQSVISMKINQYYFDFDVNDDDDGLEKKRSNKRRKIKRKPRRGRDNR